MQTVPKEKKQKVIHTIFMYFLKYIWVQASKQKEKEALFRIQKNYFDDLEEKNVIETL